MTKSFSRPPLETSAAGSPVAARNIGGDVLDRARLARIRARLDGCCQEFDAGIDKILLEVERLRGLRNAFGYLGERVDCPATPPPLPTERLPADLVETIR